MTDNTNIWLNGIMGVVIGDALGCPVQFESRDEVARHPVTGMRGYGTFNLPEGNFMKWLYDGEFTPYGESYDIGRGTMQAINRYKKNRKAKKCGGDEEWNNGNGSLMRIMPACLYCSVMESSGMYSDRDAIDVIHSVGGLTHAHIRSNIACGLYFFMAKYILFREGSLQERIQEGLTQGFAFYESYLADKENLHYYDRLKDLEAFKSLPADKIKSTGYVVDALEAAVWSLITTDSFDQALLKAVNLGDDTDTVGAIAGGLAGLYYGYDSIPEDWLSAIKRREWIEGMCRIREQ